jgi:hypothetical protein
MATETVEKPKKNKYSKDVLEKIKAGKPWIYPLNIHPKNATKLVEDIESNPSGGEYQKLLNNIIAKHYKIKIK